MGFMQGDAQPANGCPCAAEPAIGYRRGKRVEDVPGDGLGGGYPACKGRRLVQIGVVQRFQHAGQQFGGAADIDGKPVLVQICLLYTSDAARRAI